MKATFARARLMGTIKSIEESETDIKDEILGRFYSLYWDWQYHETVERQSACNCACSEEKS